MEASDTTNEPPKLGGGRASRSSPGGGGAKKMVPLDGCALRAPLLQGSFVPPRGYSPGPAPIFLRFFPKGRPLGFRLKITLLAALGVITAAVPCASLYYREFAMASLENEKSALGFSPRWRPRRQGPKTTPIWRAGSWMDIVLQKEALRKISLFYARYLAAWRGAMPGRSPAWGKGLRPGSLSWG